jgi:putative nucleotidyltransferase with HDIG domain
MELTNIQELERGFDPTAWLRTHALKTYAGGLGLVALATVAALATSSYSIEGPGAPWLFLAFAGLAILAEQRGVRLTSSIEMSVAFLPLLFVAVVFGPFAAALIGACTVLTDFGQPHLRWIVWTASRTLIGAAAGLAAVAGFALGGGGVGGIALATVFAAGADFALDVVLTSMVLVLRGTGSLRSLVRITAPVAAAGIPLYTAIVGFIAFATIQLTPWSAVLFFIPAFAAQKLFVLYQDQRDAAASLGEANLRLESANLSFATALVATLDARDRYTAGHSAAVAVYSRDIARRMGLSEDEERLAHLAGLVHDIGKVGLPAGLLEKTGPLSLDERRLMEQHSAIGERILANVHDYGEIARIVRHHHERFDGAGYPDSLVATEIPIISRIIAVADGYNAMTSDRPYRDAMPSRVARLRLAQAVDAQFDTAVVAAFEAILASATEPYRMGVSPEFDFAVQDRAAESEASVDPVAA